MQGSELKRERRKSEGKRRMKGFDSIPNLSDEDDNMGMRCLYCDVAGERVLICGQSGCPVTLHANCLDFEPQFDDLGNFCCPYCWYKYSIDVCQRLKEKALTAKRDYLVNVHVNPVQDTRDNTQIEAQPPAFNEVEGKVQDSEQLAQEIETQSQQRDYLVNAHVNPVQDTREQLMDKTQIEAQPPEFNEDECKVQDREQLVEEIETQSQQNQDEGAVRNSENPVVEIEIPTEAQSHKNQDDRKVQDREETKTNTETEAQSSSLRQQSQRIEPCLRKVGRRRSLWTAEEEKFLREGVSKFLGKDQKNIPWRKILEFGSHVFDKTRTPANLKDKWKNIISKEGRKRKIEEGV